MKGLMMKFIRGKIFKFVVVPILAIVLIIVAVDQYQKNRITEKDKEYVEWHDEHYQKLDIYTEVLEALRDDYTDYVEETPVGQQDGHAFLRAEAEKYPELYDMYNKPDFANLTQEAIEHPYPDNKLLRNAHASYKVGNRELQRFAVDLLDGIGDDDVYAPYTDRSGVYFSYLSSAYFQIRDVERDHEELD